jgi:hypothetical protein
MNTTVYAPRWPSHDAWQDQKEVLKMSHVYTKEPVSAPSDAEVREALAVLDAHFINHGGARAALQVLHAAVPPIHHRRRSVVSQTGRDIA